MSSSKPEPLQLKNKYGKVAMEITSVSADRDVIVIKGEALGTMPITVNVTGDAWAARQFLTWPVIRKVPAMFIKGWWQSRKDAGKAPHKAGRTEATAS